MDKRISPVIRLEILKAQKAGCEAMLEALRGCDTLTDRRHLPHNIEAVNNQIKSAEEKLEKLNGHIEFLEYKIEDWISDHF